MSLPTNPYIAGAPLRGEKGFFGRQDTMEWVQRELLNSQTNALVLFGQRRIGKTTLLLQLARSLSPDEFLPIYFDLQDQATRPLGQTLTDIADILCEKADIDLGQLGPFDDQGHYFQKDFLPKFYAALGEKRRPVFLLDEFDVLDQTAEAELAETATAKALFPLLRRLINTDDRSAFVFVVGRRAEDLSIDFNATLKASLVREIWVLDQKSAEDLVRQAQTNGTLEFSEDAIQRVLNLTNHHPYLTQLLCQRIWELAHATQMNSLTKIGSAQVDFAVESSLEVGNQALDWLWNGLNPAEKIYASALADIARENEIIPEERIIEVLATHAARLRTREIELAPRDLVKRHVLDVSGERKYCFAVELFRRWVQKNKPLAVVKDEVDRIDPMADRLFVFGNDFYDARQWEKANFYFREALNINPRHFRARLYLGETLLEQGKIDEAIVELDQALILDREEARLPLARALIALAQEKEKNKLDQDALTASERALEISPNERLAQDIRKNILERQGESALEENDLDTALAAFEKAGNSEKAEQVRKEYKKKDLQILEEEAKTLAQKMEWNRAISIYEQLVEKAPDEKSKVVWQSSLAKCKEEEKLESLFTLGLGALTSGDWEQAKKTFSEVVYIRPDYVKDNKSAVKLLGQAVAGRKPITVETVFQSSLFRILGSASLLVVLGYFVFSAIRGVAVETQEPTQVVSTSTVVSAITNIVATETPSSTITPVPNTPIAIGIPPVMRVVRDVKFGEMPSTDLSVAEVTADDKPKTPNSSISNGILRFEEPILSGNPFEDGIARLDSNFKVKEGNGYLLLYRTTDPGTQFLTVFESGSYNQVGYRSVWFGSGDYFGGPFIEVFRDQNSIYSQPLNIQLQQDTWYYLLMRYYANNVEAKIWKKDNPEIVYSFRTDVGTEWTKNDFLFHVLLAEGAIEFDEFQEVEFSSSESLPLADSTLYDDFTNTKYDGAYNSALWSKAGNNSLDVVQESGALTLKTTDATTGGEYVLLMKQPSIRPIDRIQFFEARLRLDEIQQGFSFAKIQIVAENINGYTWSTQCGLGWSGGTSFICTVDDFDSNGSRTNEYGSDEIKTKLNTWYTVRIEIDPTTATIHFYLDGVEIGTFTPKDATELISANNFVPRIGVWDESSDSIFKYEITDVRITP